MGRPPLPIGHHGNVNVTALDGGGYQALTRLRCLDGVTRRVKARGRTKQAARTALQAAIAERVKLGAGADLSADSTVRELAEAWKPTMEQNPSTVEKYLWHLDRHILPGLGEVRLREATTARVEGFLRAVPTPSARLMCRSVLSLMLGMAARYDAIPSNPVRDVVLPKATRAEPVAPKEADLEQLQADVDAWVSAQSSRASTRRQLGDAIEMYLVTGARTGEVLGMLGTDFDTRAHTWTISGTVKRTTEAGLYRQAWPKTKKKTRIVLPAEAMVTVRRLVLAAPTALLFHTRDGGPLEPANFRRALREFTEDYPRWSGVTPRSFRKAVATIVDHEHGSERAAAQLGHSSDEVTKRHYIEPVGVAPDSSPVLRRFARGS